MSLRASFWLVVLLAASASCSDSESIRFTPPPRADGRIVTVENWDTVFYRPIGLEDTLLIDPTAITIWGDTLALADDIVQRVVLLESRGGRFLRTLGQKGQGPGEFRWITDVFVGDDDVLRVTDGENRRLSAYSHSGHLIWEKSLAELSGAPWTGIAVGDRHLFTRIPAQQGVFEFSATDESVSFTPFQWPDTPPSALVSSRLGHEPGGDRWVTAFTYGPGFLVFEGESFTAHTFVDPVAFRRRGSPEKRDGGTDFVEYAARSLSVSGERVFFLYGGQPQRRENPEGSPTRWIDIYLLSGEYQESWLLPGGGWDFSTDGSRLFVIQTEPEHAVIALRPVYRNGEKSRMPQREAAK
jgi:6-bladed beta-propeller